MTPEQEKRVADHVARCKERYVRRHDHGMGHTIRAGSRSLAEQELARHLDAIDQELAELRVLIEDIPIPKGAK